MRRGQESWTETVIDFLRREASKAATLFLVGDLFDFWFEWRHSVPGAAFPVLAELNRLVQEGKEIIYLAGNHDGHPGRFLEKEVGLTVSRKPVDVEIDGRKFHVIHGDGVSPADRAYRVLRALVRWKATETIYRYIHPDLGIRFAHQLSKISHDTGGNRKATDLTDYIAYAVRRLDEGYNYVVMGHIHTAHYQEHENGAYISIGDWIGKRSYGVFENGELRLKYFKTD